LNALVAMGEIVQPFSICFTMDLSPL
jgi:hypothetical protein